MISRSRHILIHQVGPILGIEQLTLTCPVLLCSSRRQEESLRASFHAFSRFKEIPIMACRTSQRAIAG